MYNTLKTLFLFFLIPFHCAFSVGHWAELPRGDYKDILLSTSSKCNKLNRLIESYHKEPKDCPIAASIRIDKLRDIQDYLNRWIAEEPDNHHLKDLLNHVENKYLYLCSIMRLYLTGKVNEVDQKAYHLTSSEDALNLSNDIYYSLSEKQYLGAHWIESIDPCHRVLGDYYQKWLTLKNTKKACPWFFLWLEKQNVPVNTPTITYLNSAELDAAQLFIHENRLCNPASTEPLEGNYLYVVDMNDRTFLIEKGPSLYFSSISHGKPLKAALYLECRAGIVTKVIFDNERYVPATLDKYQRVFSLLKENDIPFSSEVTVQYSYNRMKYQIAIHSTMMDDECVFLNELLYQTRSQTLNENSTKQSPIGAKRSE